MQENPSVSFVLPMYNESDNIESTVNTLKSLASELGVEYEVVIVDDASTDASVHIVQNMASVDSTIRLFCLEKNTKFGGAFAKGFKEASKDVIIYMDSDMPVGPEDIKKSLPLVEDADIVTGYSKIEKGETVRRKIISGVYNFIVQTLFDLNIKDINSGYKIIRRDLLDGMEFISQSPFADVELFIHARKNNKKVKQFPLIFNPRVGGKSYIARLPIILATFCDMIKVKLSTG